MPIYEYSCDACGHHLEAFQKMSEAPLNICPECQKPRLTKLISAAGFQLKGTGWYATDFKNKGKIDTNQGKTEAQAIPSTDTESAGNVKNDKETKSSNTSTDS